jgi:enterochelin esterase-like enzyme
MRTLLLVAVTLGMSTASALGQEIATRVVSPEIAADRRVTFRLYAPDAREVVLTGEFIQGAKPLYKSNDGVWSVAVGPIEPEIYHYNFTIDGVRTIDPGNAQVKTGSTSSTLASVLEVRGDAPFFFDARPVPHGDLRRHWYHSTSLGTVRRVTVYTPPNYDRDTAARYPVVYLLHGANADDEAWGHLGRVNLILDNLLADGKIKPFIVVMPFGYGAPPLSPAARSQNTELFGQDLIEDAIPFVETRYRVSASRDDRAIVGLSMGGGQALSIGLNHLDLFSHVGGFSSGLGNAPDFAKSYPSVVSSPTDANSRLRLLWIGCGTEDGAFAASKNLSEFLKTNNVTHTFREASGAHTWMVWRRFMNEISPLLFK